MSGHEVADALSGWVPLQRRLAASNEAFCTGHPSERPTLEELATLRAEEAKAWAYVMSALRRGSMEQGDQ